jgi:hypothetical protein
LVYVTRLVGLAVDQIQVLLDPPHVRVYCRCFSDNPL